MGLRKISEPTVEEMCQSTEHNPPMFMVYSPGTYEYTCPGCGAVQRFSVPLIN